MTNHHSRKTFFAKAIAGLAAVGLFGQRLSAKSAAAPGATGEASSSSKAGSVQLQTDARAVARSSDFI